MQDFFEANTKAIESKNPQLAARLKAIKPNTRYEVFTTNDALNFNIIDKTDNTPLFTTNALEQTQEKIVEFMPYSLHPYLYFFGAGNGVFFKALAQNENLKCALIIEPQAEILFIIFHLLDFSKEISESKLIFLDSQTSYQEILNFFIRNKHSKIYSKLYNLHIFNSYYEKFSTQSIAFNKMIINALEHCVISVGNDSRDAIIGISHHIANLPDMLRSPSLISLINELKSKRTNGFNTPQNPFSPNFKYAGSSAVIVATGPSLSKQLPLLKKYQDYLTIFCIDASLPILAREDIKPDVVFSLERVDLTAKFYEQTPKQARDGVIFEITSIVHKRLKDALAGDLVQYSMRPFGYTYFFGLKDYGYIGVGMSAANMAYEMCVYSRFARVILIGQDLAFSESGASHAKNAVYGEKEIDPKNTEKTIIKLPAYGGDGEVESTNIWKLFLEFYEADIAQTPYKIEVINATEGGARIQGTTEMPFAKILEQIDTSEKKQKLELSAPDSETIKQNLQHASKKVQDFLDFGAQKKAKVEEVFLEVAKLTEDLEAQKNDLENFDFSRVESAIEHIDEVKDFFNDSKFTTCFNDAIQSYIVHQEMDIAKIVVQVVDSEIALKAKQIELLYAHKYWLFSLAGGLDCVLEKVRESFESWEI